ncbi:hypothetical protein ASF12_11230 [Paenibacillus sp. Leaf72]|nr:hypothetical protein ASF12_11230 [Paenibacillus sp. Leaf72]
MRARVLGCLRARGGALISFLRTEIPLFWLFNPFQAISGQEIRYRPHFVVKMASGIALAAPESATYALTRNSIKIAAAVSAKSNFVQGLKL